MFGNFGRFFKRETCRAYIYLFKNKNSDLKELSRFASGLEKDLSAMQNAVANSLSNGFVEGTNSKLKMIKCTSMYGRCNKELLATKLIYIRWMSISTLYREWICEEKMNIKKLRNNWMFIFTLFIYIVCFIKKNNYLPVDIVPYPDGWQTFSAKQGVLEQTWISEVTEINKISIEVLTMDTFDEIMHMKILEGATGNIVFSGEKECSFEEGIQQKISFDLNSVKLKTGKQYIFQLSYSNVSDNELKVKIGSNYMGCSIGGEVQNVGVAFKLTYVKNSLLFWLFASFLPFVSISFLLMVIFQRKWEEVVGLTLSAIVFILFILGIFEHLETGVYLVYTISAICMLVGIVIYNKKNMEVKELWSSGVLFYAIAFILILLNSRALRFARWDEFSHWGLAVKDMFYSNAFAKHLGSTVMIKYYPPVATLVEYFFCYTNRFFSDSMVYVGFQVFCLSMLSNCLSGLRRNRWITVTIVIFLSPMIFFNDVYHCVYADPLMACAVCYILVCYYKEKLTGFNMFRILGGLFLLTLTKDIGVVIAGVLTLAMIGDVCYQQFLQREWNFKEFFRPAVCMIWTCFLFITWQVYLSIPEKYMAVEETKDNAVGAVTGAIGASGASGINLQNILGLLRGQDDGYRFQVIKNYITKIFSTDIFNFDIFSFSYMDFAIILAAVAIIFSGVTWIKDKENRLISFGVFTFIAGLGYCAFLLVTYLFSFSQGEALLVTSFERYMGSYIGGVFIALCVLLIGQIDEEKKKYERMVLTIIASIVIIAAPMERFVTTNMDTRVTDDQVYGFNELADIIRSGAKENDKVFFICNNSDGHARLQMRNALVPILTENVYYNVFDSVESYSKQIKLYAENGKEEKGGASFLTKEELKKLLHECQYVVLFHPNDVFKESYGELFDEEDTIDDGTVYKICGNEDKMVLQYVGRTEIKEFR